MLADVAERQDDALDRRVGKPVHAEHLNRSLAVARHARLAVRGDACFRAGQPGEVGDQRVRGRRGHHDREVLTEQLGAEEANRMRRGIRDDAVGAADDDSAPRGTQ